MQEPKRILVADAARHLAHFLRRVLERDGYVVRTVDDGRSVKRIVEEWQPNAIILELDLPGVSGLELCQELRKEHPVGELWILFATAHAYTAGESLRAAGADWYFPKPMSPGLLLHKLDELFDREAELRSCPLANQDASLGRYAERLTELLGTLEGCSLSVCLRDGDEHRWVLRATDCPWPTASPPVPELMPGDTQVVQARDSVRLVTRDWSVWVCGAEELPRHLERVEVLLRAAADLAEAEQVREGLCSELEGVFSHVASMFRADWNQRSGVDPRRCLELIVADLTGRRQTWRAALWTVAGAGFEPVAWSHDEPPALPLDAGPLARTLDSGRGQLFDESEASSLPGLEQARSLAVAPLLLPGNSLGCLALWSLRPHEFNARIVGRLLSFAHRAAMTLQHARLQEDLLRTERLRQEHALGGEIQDALLRSWPHYRNERVSVAAYSSACRHVGGDFYEILPLGRDRLDVVIGDVMGKGLPAAVFAAAAKNQLLREIALGATGPDGAERLELPALVKALNVRLSGDLARFDAFVTLCYGRLDMRANEFSMVDCGHTNVLHYSAASDSVRTLHHDPEGITNLPLGIRPDCEFRTLREPCANGDLLCLYSDGIIEAHDGHEEYGVNRLCSLLLRHHDRSTTDLTRLVRRDVASFLGGKVPRDDLTLLVVRVGGEPRDVIRTTVLELPARDGHLAEVRAFVSAALAPWPEVLGDTERLTKIQLAVVEATTNVIRHAYEQAAGEMTLETECSEECLLVRVTDQGASFDHEEVPEPVFDGSEDSGFGLFIMRQVADEVLYEHGPAGENCLTLSFTRNTTQPTP